jgi:hypothetical protein
MRVRAYAAAKNFDSRFASLFARFTNQFTQNSKLKICVLASPVFLTVDADFS